MIVLPREQRGSLSLEAFQNRPLTYVGLSEGYFWLSENNLGEIIRALQLLSDDHDAD